MNQDATQRFAEDAEKGGYDRYKIPETFDRQLYADEKMLLDPAAWRAVGKTRGWPRDNEPEMKFVEWKRNWWLGRWHRFIDALAEGKTINASLEAIE